MISKDLRKQPYRIYYYKLNLTTWKETKSWSTAKLGSFWRCSFCSLYFGSFITCIRKNVSNFYHIYWTGILMSSSHMFIAPHSFKLFSMGRSENSYHFMAGLELLYAYFKAPFSFAICIKIEALNGTFQKVQAFA